MLKKFFVVCITAMLVLCSFAACQKTGDGTTDTGGGAQNSEQVSEDKGNENGQDSGSDGNNEGASSGTDDSASHSPEVEFPDVPLA